MGCIYVSGSGCLVLCGSVPGVVGRQVEGSGISWAGSKQNGDRTFPSEKVDRQDRKNRLFLQVKRAG